MKRTTRTLPFSYVAQGLCSRERKLCRSSPSRHRLFPQKIHWTKNSSTISYAKMRVVLKMPITCRTPSSAGPQPSCHRCLLSGWQQQGAPFRCVVSQAGSRDHDSRHRNKNPQQQSVLFVEVYPRDISTQARKHASDNGFGSRATAVALGNNDETYNQRHRSAKESWVKRSKAPTIRPMVLAPKRHTRLSA